MPKYSEVKEKFKIEVKKPEQTDLAYLTHYFQSHHNGIAHYFEEGAVVYGQSIDPSVVDEPYFQGYLPFEWDIPFPPHQRGEFKFIDLFVGIGGFRLAFHNLGVTLKGRTIRFNSSLRCGLFTPIPHTTLVVN